MALPRHEVDVVVIGAGAAGLAAARKLVVAPITLLVLEAEPHPGGRARTLTGPFPIDLGCGWLHSADRNPWTAIAEKQGLTIDRTPPPWRRQSGDLGFSAADQDAFRAAFATFEARIEAGRELPDRAAADLLEPDGRWNPLMNAVASYVNGVEFDRLSAHDHGNYADTGMNWRIVEGYGHAVCGLAPGLPIVHGVQATSIDHSSPILRITTTAGEIAAKAVIVTVSTNVLVAGGLRFSPDLPEKIEAAAGLPLGLTNKVFLAVDEPEALPADGHLYGATDRIGTGTYTLRPFGRPLVEGFFGGTLAHALEKDGDAAIAAFAIDELAGLFGGAIRQRLSFVTATCWGKQPHVRGAYSYALPGQAGSRPVLAAPVAERIFFAGEACSQDSYSTAHGAYATGIAAAEDAMRALGSAPSR